MKLEFGSLITFRDDRNKQVQATVVSLKGDSAKVRPLGQSYLVPIDRLMDYYTVIL